MDPVNGNIKWRRIEALFLALGATKDEGTGAGVTFILNGRRADFHRPQSNKEALRYRVKAWIITWRSVSVPAGPRKNRIPAI